MTSADTRITKKEKTALSRKKQIFESGLHLFLKKGFKGTTMQEIAAEVGITAPGLYTFVESKQDIIEMIAEGSVVDFEVLNNFRRNLGDISPTQALQECCKYWLTISKIEQDKAVVLERETVNFDTDTQQLVFHGFRGFIRLFEELLIDGVKAREFQVDNVNLVAFNIVMMRFNYAMRRWYLREAFTPEEYASVQTDIILKQVAVAKSGKIHNSS